VAELAALTRADCVDKLDGDTLALENDVEISSTPIDTLGDHRMDAGIVSGAWLIREPRAIHNGLSFGAEPTDPLPEVCTGRAATHPRRPFSTTTPATDALMP
jgi:hypothetical protein